MSIDPKNHPDELQLEGYSLGTISKPEAVSLEEHLLICEACRERLSETEDYARSMQRASARARTEPRGMRWISGFPRLIPALAAALLVLGIGVAWRMNQKIALAPVAVTLEATRGGGQVAQVPAGKPLLLKPGLDGLPALPEYHLEIVDRTGKRVWQTNFVPAAGVAAPEQAPGIYFVRLYSLPGALLREYVMEIKTGL
jgi:hypothetical protein